MELPKSRLDSLYRDFRHMEELNPDGYRANIETWKAYLIGNYLEHSKSIFFRCGSGLLRDLSRNSHGVPRSIDLVINSLVESDYLVNPADFYNGMMYPQEGFRVLRWIGFFTKAKRGFESRENNDTYYLKETNLIIRHILEEKFEEVRKHITQNIISHATGITDLIFSKQEFYDKSGINKLVVNSEEERNAMLFYLSYYKKTIVQDAEIVKVISPEAVHILADFPKTLTEDDHRIASLKASLSNVALQTKKVRAQLGEYSSMLHEAIVDSQPKEIQRNYLQSKKMIERNLSRLLAYQNNLFTVKSQLDMAVTNQLLVSTLEGSGKLLKSINDYTGSMQKIEDLLDEVKEQGERAEVVNELLTNSGFTEEEDTELDKELELMEQEENQKTVKKVKESEEKKENLGLGESSEELIEKLENLKIEGKTPPGGLREKNSNSAPDEQHEAVAEV